MPYWSRGIQSLKSHWASPTWALRAGLSLEALTASIPSAFKSLQRKEKVEGRTPFLKACSGPECTALSTHRIHVYGHLVTGNIYLTVLPSSQARCATWSHPSAPVSTEGWWQRYAQTSSLSQFAFDEERKMWCFPATEAAGPRSVECCSNDSPNQLKNSWNHQAAWAMDSLFWSCKHGLHQCVPLSYLSQEHRVMMIVSFYF